MSVARQLSLCRLILVQGLPLHLCRVVIFTFSGCLGLKIEGCLGRCGGV